MPEVSLSSPYTSLSIQRLVSSIGTEAAWSLLEYPPLAWPVLPQPEELPCVLHEPPRGPSSPSLFSSSDGELGRGVLVLVHAAPLSHKNCAVLTNLASKLNVKRAQISREATQPLRPPFPEGQRVT